jgi:hypothetical protein
MFDVAVVLVVYLLLICYDNSNTPYEMLSTINGTGEVD